MYLEKNKIYHGKSEELIKQIEPESVACSIWSPPYHVGKNYEKGQSYDEWREMLRIVIAGHFRVLKPGCFMVVNIADILCFPDTSMPRIQHPNPGKHKCKVTGDDILRAMKRYPDYNRYQLAEVLACSEQTIDRRLHGNNIRGGKYAAQTRVQLVGSMVQEYALQAGLFLYDRRIWKKDPAWQNSQWHSSSYRSVDEFEYLYIFWKPGETVVNRERLTSEEWVEWGSRGVWEFPSVRANKDHEAMFPLELPRRCIKLLTETGELVIDPFIGSGTTACAAKELKRDYIGIEKCSDAVQLSRSRLAQVNTQDQQMMFEV